MKHPRHMSGAALVAPYMVFIMLMLLTAPLCRAQTEATPTPLLSIQGELFRQDSTPYPDGTVELTVTFYDRAVGGKEVHTQRIATRIVEGLYNVILGDEVSLAWLDLTRPYWFEIRAAGDAVPRSRMMIQGATPSK